MFLVPTVDIGSADRAARLDAACREVGFVQITGHGIPDAVADDLAAALDAYFALPLEVKKRHRRPPGDNRGYSPPRSESLSMSLGVPSASGMNDYYEAFIVGSETTSYPDVDLPATSYPHNTWPDEVPGFRPAVEAWFTAAQALSRTLLGAFAEALNLPHDHFAAMTDHSIDALKMNNYALPEGEVELSGDVSGMGAHTDFGILTVLWADQMPGLQVLGPDGAWHDVQPADGALLVNLGDAMARWTNDRWRSTVHRVDPPIVDGRIRRRRSAAFFFDGNHDAVIETLPGCSDAGPGYPPITVAENLATKIAGMRTGTFTRTDLRESARVLAARTL